MSATCSLLELTMLNGRLISLKQVHAVIKSVVLNVTRMECALAIIHPVIWISKAFSSNDD